MKKYRVVMLVIFMLMMSVFAFVSQGEEAVLINEADQTSFEIEVNKIKLQTQIKAADNLATERHEQALLMQKIEALKFNEAEKLNSYFETKAVEKQMSDNKRVDEIMRLTPLDQETAAIVIEYADKYDIRPSLILGVMDLESNFNPNLVGTSDDRGYMQIIPGTEKWLVKAYGEELNLTYDPSRIFDADYNIPLAVKYLSILKKEYGNDTQMLTSYNRGDYGMEKWFKKHGTYETAYSRVILKREKKYLTVK